jgi:uncharacterized DUF497 family protein
MVDRYEWDRAKQDSKLAKHGIDFNEIARFEWATATVVPDRRVDYGEVRFRAYGRLGGRACVVIFTRRGEVLRIISFRRANRRERAEHG